jgi:hypothetical protein
MSFPERQIAPFRSLLPTSNGKSGYLYKIINNYTELTGKGFFNAHPEGLIFLSARTIVKPDNWQFLESGR